MRRTLRTAWNWIFQCINKTLFTNNFPTEHRIAIILSSVQGGHTCCHITLKWFDLVHASRNTNHKCENWAYLQKLVYKITFWQETQSQNHYTAFSTTIMPIDRQKNGWIWYSHLRETRVSLFVTVWIPKLGFSILRRKCQK